MELDRFKSRLRILNGEIEASKWERKQLLVAIQSELVKEAATKIASLKNEDESMLEFSITIHLNELLNEIKNLNE